MIRGICSILSRVPGEFGEAGGVSRSMALASVSVNDMELLFAWVNFFVSSALCGSLDWAWAFEATGGLVVVTFEALPNVLFETGNLP